MLRQLIWGRKQLRGPGLQLYFCLSEKSGHNDTHNYTRSVNTLTQSFVLPQRIHCDGGVTCYCRLVQFGCLATGQLRDFLICRELSSYNFDWITGKENSLVPIWNWNILLAFQVQLSSGMTTEAFNWSKQLVEISAHFLISTFSVFLTGSCNIRWENCSPMFWLSASVVNKVSGEFSNIKLV